MTKTVLVLDNFLFFLPFSQEYFVCAFELPGSSELVDVSAKPDDDADQNRYSTEDVNITQESEEPLLVERDGKFQVLNTVDVTADDADRQSFNSDEDEDRCPITPASQTKSEGHERGRSSKYGNHSRSRSAYAFVPDRKSQKNNCSKGLPENYQLLLEQQRIRKEEQRRADDEKKQLEEQKKRDACDAAFDAWLRKKKTEAAERHREERQSRREHKKHEEDKVVVLTMFYGRLVLKQLYVLDIIDALVCCCH
jgi:hypothetical protein